MTDRTSINGLSVDTELYEAVNTKYIPGTGIDPSSFWSSFADIVRDLTPRNKALLKVRTDLQHQIDLWHVDHRGKPHDGKAYETFLRKIGYLADDAGPLQVNTENVDPEISTMAGPQLVVPMNNARYALNAANARWGSLYDALYGTDVIPEVDGATRGDQYNPVRGARVVDYVSHFLDRAVPFVGVTYGDIKEYRIVDRNLRGIYKDNQSTQLENTNSFRGYTGSTENPSSILLQHNGLHIELKLDKQHPIGSKTPSGLCDVILESAITTIQDLEDSVSTVDASDKVDIYNHWLGLMTGDLSVAFSKNNETVHRSLNPDREYNDSDGKTFALPGRSVMLIRHVGHLTTNPAIITEGGDEIFEGLMDAMITSLISLHDLKKQGEFQNSRTGSLYVVKPKMHGPEETEFAVEILKRVEVALNMEPNTIKIGIMDEERRTTVNLKECIRAASQRIIFINTGFLDRTGDEIHTTMESGPMIPKADMKTQPWIKAYENWNVDIGIECGLPGYAQIGKGMWAMPDEMAQMMQSKIDHPKSGATTAWVPSPTAATLHAMHYHQIDVTEQQKQLGKRSRAKLDEILMPPYTQNPKWSGEEIQNELKNNCQGILGYVVRWIDQGVGCSKVPDINDIGLMEDRATLRISSQHIANWLHHGITTESEVVEILKKMAEVVDRQNAGDSNYRNMAPNFDGVAFQAAQDLIFLGRDITNGYTEPTLHARRLELKAKQTG